MNLTQADFARRHGVSRKTVTVWKGQGRVILHGNQVDVEASDAFLRDARLGQFRPGGPGDELLPADGELSEPVLPEAAVLPAGESLPARLATPRPALAGSAEPVLTDLDPETIGAFLTGLLTGRFGSQAAAERIKENALAGLRALELKAKAGSLIDVSLAEAVFFDQARGERDGWINWPSRIGPLLAAEFDVPADKMTEALSRHVHSELDGRSEAEPDFTRRAG